MSIKIALPKGRLLDETAALLKEAGWELSGYHAKARFYHLKSQRFPALFAKVFHEKDIPIQVSIGNYDLGICGLDWVEELLVKYPSSGLVRVKSLGYGEGVLCMVASRSEKIASMKEMQAKPGLIRIASEYPNLADSFAARNRLRRFRLFPLWGAAEVYPPESADLALICGRKGEDFGNCGLTTVTRVLDFSAFLIANRSSWESKDMGEVLASLGGKLPAGENTLASADMLSMPEVADKHFAGSTLTDAVWLALPDGHQQLPTLQLLNRAGIQISDYPSSSGNRRPDTNLDGVMVKVIRPQDMPLQVANGNFDLAITGRDWLIDHLYQFTTSPVRELLNLGFGKVKIVAVVGKELPVPDVRGLGILNAKSMTPFRVASEYVNIADKYVRDNHLGPYRVIPTWGASEAFLTDDADLLIENTQTGQTLLRHNLRIVDTLFESTACLIGNPSIAISSSKKKRIESIIETLRNAVEDA